jgi:2'-5' RNA ligase
MLGLSYPPPYLYYIAALFLTSYNKTMSETIDQPVYFIGITLPTDLERRVSRIQWMMYDNNKDLLKPLLPHVTLLHPPSLRSIMPDEFIPRVREVAERYLPLTIAVQELGFFGKQVGFVRCQSQGLVSLQSQLVGLLPPEAQAVHYRREYMPHITLAQAYEPHELDMAMLEKEASSNLPLPQQFTVDSVSCFQRILPRTYRAKQV